MSADEPYSNTDIFFISVIRSLARFGLLDEPIKNDAEAIGIWRSMSSLEQEMLLEAYSRIDWGNEHASQ